MKIVLLGGSGFVGRNLLPVLTSGGHHCTVLTRDPERCRDIRLLPNVTLKRADPYDVDSLTATLSGADAVINLVGILNESGRNGKGFERAHVTLTDNLLRACEGAGVRRFIQISALGADTDSPGASHYLKTKGRAEQLVAASNLDFTIVRPSVIFGVDDSFFNRFAGLLRWIPVLPLACPNAQMQPVWVGDVANAVGRMVEAPDAIAQTYTLVGPKKYKLIQLVRFTASAMGKKRLIIGLPDFVSRVQGLLCDFVPGKPFSSDNYRSLKIANVSDKNGLPALGIDPRPLKGLVKSYLRGSSRQLRLDTIRSGHHDRH
jgi:NADH dehydrogenase